MSDQRSVTFQEALDILESLPVEQREYLIEIVRGRLIDHRRELLAENIRKAREEYARGEVKKGTVEELMRELANENPDLG